MKYAKVVFLGQEECFGATQYSYKTGMDDLSVGDIVVVQARDTHALAIVKSVSLKKDTKATRWVVQKVDLEHSKNLDKRGKEIEEKERELADRIAERESAKAMEALVADDPEAKKLYAELKELRGF